MSPKETERSPQAQREGAVKSTEPSAVQRSLHSQSPGSGGDLWSPVVSQGGDAAGYTGDRRRVGRGWVCGRGRGSILKMHGLPSRKRAPSWGRERPGSKDLTRICCH